MVAPAFHGLADEAFAAGRPVSSFVVQRMHESLEFIKAERGPQIGLVFAQHYYDAGNQTVRLPRYGFAQWAIARMLRVWCPARATDCEVLLYCKRDESSVDVAAWSTRTHRGVTADQLDQWVTDTRGWTATVSSGTYHIKRLTGIRCRPGWNKLAIAVRGASDDKTGPFGSSARIDTGAIMDTGNGELVVDATMFATTADRAEVPEMWVRFIAGGTSGAGETPYTAARIRKDTTWRVSIAEDYIPASAPTENQVAGGGDRDAWVGALGVLEVKSITTNFAVGSDSYVKDPRLRFYMPVGAAVKMLIKRCTDLLEFRMPQLVIGGGRQNLDEPYPREFFAVDRYDYTGSSTVILKAPYKHRQTVATEHTPAIEVILPCFRYGVVGNDPDTFTVRVIDAVTGSVVVTTSDTRDVVSHNAAEPEARRTVRWADKAGTFGGRGSVWSHNGATALEDVDGVWDDVVLRVSAADLDYDGHYQIQIGYQAGGGGGVIYFGDWAARIVPNSP